MKNVFHLTQVPFVYALVTKIQEDGRDTAVNSLELPCENSLMEHAFPLDGFQRDNRTTFSIFQLYRGLRCRPIEVTCFLFNVYR